MTHAALTFPGLDTAGPWQIRKRSDAAGNALADRHYPRRRPGVGNLGANGRTLVLVTHDELALWVTSWPQYPMDGLDAWRCSVFRNEGATRSSVLIIAAMVLNETLWADTAADGWLTYVDTARVRSTNPGCCFKAASWRRDHTYCPDRRRRTLIRLQAEWRTPRESIYTP